MIKIVKKDNTIFQGAKAINLIIIQNNNNFKYIIKFIEYSIILFFIEKMIYYLFAKNRSFISKIFRLNSCKIR